jgi:hypothetical protein
VNEDEKNAVAEKKFGFKPFQDQSVRGRQQEYEKVGGTVHWLIGAHALCRQSTGVGVSSSKKRVNCLPCLRLLRRVEKAIDRKPAS